MHKARHLLGGQVPAPRGGGGLVLPGRRGYGADAEQGGGAPQGAHHNEREASPRKLRLQHVVHIVQLDVLLAGRGGRDGNHLLHAGVMICPYCDLGAAVSVHTVQIGDQAEPELLSSPHAKPQDSSDEVQYGTCESDGGDPVFHHHRTGAKPKPDAAHKVHDGRPPNIGHWRICPHAIVHELGNSTQEEAEASEDQGPLADYCVGLLVQFEHLGGIGHLVNHRTREVDDPTRDGRHWLVPVQLGHTAGIIRIIVVRLALPFLLLL
mmetsp:Transcript_7108/g.17034  ORF Transcript_7108/g.17034 Transcript_7108/m.17034 type:complete len:265 (-) Transcript_7108:596-1390(-)